MDPLTQLVLLVALAGVVLYALYWVVRKAIRDEVRAVTEAQDGLGSRGPHDSHLE